MAQIIFESRFASLGRAQAILLLIMFLIAVVVANFPHAPSADDSTSLSNKLVGKVPKDNDLLLYNAVITRVSAGEPYYQAAAEELRVGVYPLKPFVTFRLPTLAYVLAWLGRYGSLGLLISLLCITMFAFWHRLDGVFADPGRRISGVMLIAAGAAIVFQPKYVVLHEVWAGLFIALAVALRGSSRWYLAVMAGAAALMIRELALPFVLLMMAFALFEKRWRELTAWIAVILLFAPVMIAHAGEVALVVTPDDLSSPGWLDIGGFEAYLRSMRMTSPLRLWPDWLGNIGVILAFFGWMSWRSVTGLFGTLLLAGYAIIFMVLGRPENFYWGLLNAPLLLLGWVFLPRAVSDLAAILSPPKANWT